VYGADVLPIIVEFLNRVGIPTTLGPFGREGFLPGVSVWDGGLRVDPSHLVAAGDLLHEAGHMAVVPAALRRRLGNDLQRSLDAAAAEIGFEGPVLEFIGRLGEPMAIAWSYAALRKAGLPVECVFFPGSYNLNGDPAHLLHVLETGNSFGIDGLARLGMTGNAGVHRLLFDNGLPPFPHMTRWLVE
jgi:hypothetical protein